MILSLRSFRCYESFHYDFGQERAVFLVGRNGSGKTSLLEAISLLSPGKGLRNSRPEHWQSLGDLPPWGSHFSLHQGGMPVHIRMCQGSHGRELWVNESRLKNSLGLTDWVTLQWATPAMEKIFLSGMSDRRKFFDRLIFSIEPNYGKLMVDLHKLLKERLCLLKSYGPSQGSWLDAVERLLGEKMEAIWSVRKKNLEILQDRMREEEPWGEVFMEGEFESFLQGEEACFCPRRQDLIHRQLANLRSQDQKRGQNSFGPHRTAFKVKFLGKEIAICSTGEQKIGLLSLIVANAKILGEKSQDGRSYFLLLDEVMTHLDKHHRKKMMDTFLSLPFQTWITSVKEEGLGESVTPTFMDDLLKGQKVV